MGRHCHLDFIVNVEPFWMVVRLVSSDCNSSHESESFVEVFEEELLVDCVSSLDESPSRGEQRLQQLDTFLIR